MLDVVQLPSLTPELLLGSAPLPPPSGPVRFTLSDKPERERPALLRDCFARMGCRYEIDRVRDMPFHVDLTLNMLPGVLIAQGKLHGSRTRRTRALLDDDTDDAALIVSLEGPHLIEQCGKEMVLGDGEAVLVSVAHPASFTHGPGQMLALRFTRAGLAPLLRGADDGYMAHIPSGTQALSLLTSYIDLGWDERMTASPQLQQLMASHIRDLMAMMIGATRDAAHAAQGRGVRAARLNAIKRDIERRLDQADLSVATLAARHNCTPRFVQRLFETEGTTFTEYVLAGRIARAHRMLVDPGEAGEKISAVAYACGFGDVSYFNRAFRRHYGASPSDVRTHAQRKASGS